MNTRREFLYGAAAMGAAAAVPGAAFAAGSRTALKPDQLRAVYVPWGHNMWGESLPEGVKGYLMAPWPKDYDDPDFFKTVSAAIDQLDAAM